MYSEIQSVINLLSSYLYNQLPRRKIHLFGEQLSTLLTAKFQSHWYPADPQHGSSFRCIRVNCAGLVDAAVGAAAETVGLPLDEVLQHLPDDLNIWVDPGEVSYRSGLERNCTVIFSAHGPVAQSPMSPPVPQQQQQQQPQQQPPQISMYDQLCPPQAPAQLRPTLSPTLPEGLPPATTPTSEPDEPRMTVGQFAMTRFGTTKMKSSTATGMPTMPLGVPPYNSQYSTSSGSGGCSTPLSSVAEQSGGSGRGSPSEQVGNGGHEMLNDWTASPTLTMFGGSVTDQIMFAKIWA